MNTEQLHGVLLAVGMPPRVPRATMDVDVDAGTRYDFADLQWLRSVWQLIVEANIAGDNFDADEAAFKEFTKWLREREIDHEY